MAYSGTDRYLLRARGWNDHVSALKVQVRALRFLMVLVYLPVVLTCGIVAAVGITTSIPIGTLTRDPIQIADLPPYTGVLSNIGVLIWASTAAVCLFSSALVRHRPGRDANARFLLTAGMLSVWMLLDDFFTVHDVIFPRYLGIREEVPYALIALAFLGLLFTFRSVILQTDFVLLALALGAFGVSVGVDMIESSLVHYPGYYLLEDGAKFFGIASWAAYFIRVSGRETILPASSMSR